MCTKNYLAYTSKLYDIYRQSKAAFSRDILA